MTQIFNAPNVRSLKRSAFKTGIYRNKWLNLALIVSFILQIIDIKVLIMQEIFLFSDLPWTDIPILTGLSSMVFAFGEVLN